MEYIKPLIRPMEERDIEEIAKIEEMCFAVPWTKSMFEEEMRNPDAHYLVAELAGIIVGYIGFWKVIDEGHITNIAVHPGFRRRGCGRELIAAMIARAKELGITAATLEVRVSNKTAISLYESFGFTASGIRRKYYSDNDEDALLMWLRL